jgi:hypothetical protein
MRRPVIRRAAHCFVRSADASPRANLVCTVSTDDLQGMIEL